MRFVNFGGSPAQLAPGARALDHPAAAGSVDAREAHHRCRNRAGEHAPLPRDQTFARVTRRRERRRLVHPCTAALAVDRRAGHEEDPGGAARPAPPARRAAPRRRPRMHADRPLRRDGRRRRRRPRRRRGGWLGRRRLGRSGRPPGDAEAREAGAPTAGHRTLRGRSGRGSGPARSRRRRTRQSGLGTIDCFAELFDLQRRSPAGRNVILPSTRNLNPPHGAHPFRPQVSPRAGPGLAVPFDGRLSTACPGHRSFTANRMEAAVARWSAGRCPVGAALPCS